jgi:hypothetical protein
MIDRFTGSVSHPAASGVGSSGRLDGHVVVVRALNDLLKPIVDQLATEVPADSG